MGRFSIRNKNPDTRTVVLVIFLVPLLAIGVLFPVLSLVRDSGALLLGVGVATAAIVTSVVVVLVVVVHKAFRSE